MKSKKNIKTKILNHITKSKNNEINYNNNNLIESKLTFNSIKNNPINKKSINKIKKFHKKNFNRF